MPIVLILLGCVGGDGTAPATVSTASAPPPTVVPSPAAPALPPPFSLPALTRQLLVVTTEGWETPVATLARFNRSDGGWAPAGVPVPAVVGRTGVAWGRGMHPPQEGLTKAEGDSRAPAGVFRLGDAMGYSAALPESAEWPYRSSMNGAVCVDDAASSHYNQIAGPETPHDWKSAEILSRKDILYRWLLLVDHNGLVGTSQPTPGAGSCIFFHVWRSAGKGTDGCTAAAESVLVDTLRWLAPGAEPLLVQLPREEYEARRLEWGLP